MKQILAIVAATAVLFTAPISAVAQDDGSVVLTIDGKVKGGEPLQFTLADLEALGTEKTQTGTPWHDGTVTFEGVPMSKLVDHVGASGEAAYVVALNNYRTEIPLSDFGEYRVLLASKKDGEYMPVADKGPLFIIYPFDENPELKNELYYSRSAWQVRSITFE